MISTYLAIGLGGACGAVFRAFLARLLPTTLLYIPFPILLINILGCLAIGFITAFFENHSANPFVKLFLTTGFLGGFTTFSAFSLETGLLLTRHQYVLAFFYIVFSVAISILAFFCGLRICHLIKI